MKLRILSLICVLSLVLSGCAGLSRRDYSAMVPGSGHGSVSVGQKPVTTNDGVSLINDNNPDPTTDDNADAPVGEDIDVGNEERIEDILPDGTDPSETDTDIDDNSDSSDNNNTDDPISSDPSDNSDTTDTPDDTSSDPTPTPKPDTSVRDEDRISKTYTNAKDDATDPYGYKSTDSLASTYSDNFDIIAPTSNMSFAELVGDNGIYNLPEGFPEPGTYKIIVDKYYQLIMVFSKDENGDYTVPVRYMLCSTGTSSSPTRSGTFHLKSYRVRFGLFANTDVYGQYWSQIDGRMYFHSILYSKRDASSYTGSFNNLGKRASHGCIRLTVPDARWIWYNAAPGTTVIVRDGSSSDTTTAAIKKMLTLDKMPDERPGSLTGDDIPYTDNWSIDEVPHDVEFIQGSQNNS